MKLKILPVKSLERHLLKIDLHCRQCWLRLIFSSVVGEVERMSFVWLDLTLRICDAGFTSVGRGVGGVYLQLEI